MNICEWKFFEKIIEEDKYDFNQKLFKNNSIRIMVVSLFLFFEQLSCGMILSNDNIKIANIYYLTSGIMLFCFLNSLYSLKIEKANKWNDNFVTIFGIIGLSIVCFRLILIDESTIGNNMFFISVLYGFALIFYLNPIRNLMVYGSFMILFTFFYKTNQIILDTEWIRSLITNVIISFLMSNIHYYKFIREYNANRELERNNDILKKRNIEIEKINIELKKMSTRDGLTDLYNRRKLDQIIYAEHKSYEIENKIYSLILFDIDNFKQINDIHGHLIGDKLLIELSELILGKIRENDIFGRWGGEEFLLVCPNTSKNEAIKIAQRFQKIIDEYNFDNVNHLTCSFGVTEILTGENYCEVFKRADRGLYKAKKQGKNIVCSL